MAVVCRNRMLALLMALSMSVLAPMAARAASVRCGWLDNPSPGNASLYDKDGEWTIEWWDPAAGKPISSGQAVSNAGTLRLEAPPFTVDVAARLQKR